MFADTLRQIPYTPTTAQGRGVIAPIIRVTTHLTSILLDLSALAQDAALDPAEVAPEMEQINEHNAMLLANTPALSADGQIRVTSLKHLITAFATEFPGWDTATQRNNTQDTIHRISAIGAFLDTELANVRDADAGRDV